jgi:hypothetical protein
MINGLIAFSIGFFVLKFGIILYRKYRRRKRLAEIKKYKRHALEQHIKSSIVILNQALVIYSDVISQEELLVLKHMQNSQAMSLLNKYQRIQMDIDLTLKNVNHFPVGSRNEVVLRCALCLQELGHARAFLMEEVLGYKLD